MHSQFRSLAGAGIAALALFSALPAAAQSNVVVRVAPPVRVDPAPGVRPGYVWSPGHYQWRNGRYVWARGHWIAARPGHRYRQPAWRRDARGDYSYRPGGWDRDRDGVPNRADRRPNDPTRY